MAVSVTIDFPPENQPFVLTHAGGNNYIARAYGYCRPRPAQSLTGQLHYNDSANTPQVATSVAAPPLPGYHWGLEFTLVDPMDVSPATLDVTIMNNGQADTDTINLQIVLPAFFVVAASKAAKNGKDAKPKKAPQKTT